MNLHNFENYIEKKILARGYDYYENNYVTSGKIIRGYVLLFVILKKLVRKNGHRKSYRSFLNV